MSNRLVNQNPENSGTQPVMITDTLSCGNQDLWIIGGPCAVEGLSQLEAVCQTLLPEGVTSLRGGAFKPRTSPYSFQGLGEEGLRMMDEMRKLHGMVVVTEVMDTEQVNAVAEHADVLQVGSRNMQNFTLLKALGRVDKPILLKRGLAATLDEFLWAAEYIMAGGNNRVILCERGIRSFDMETRNVLDLGGVAVLKQKTHLPIIVDPSHAAGRRDIITDLSRAALAVGADGLIVEVHPNPKKSVSDAEQALSLDDFRTYMQQIEPIANAMGRPLRSTRVMAR
jgi:3-deoxy-7-phosphoheptulonate synthase